MRNHIVKRIGDGKDTFMWHDNWWENGPLSGHIPMEIMGKYGISSDVKVVDMMKKGVWIWPNNTKDEMLMMSSVQDLRQGNDVPWCKMIWFSHYIPRNAFIILLAVIGRFATQDRLMKWYPIKSANFLLYND
ncbi:hypothetical protein Tco_0655105 [Tanacetum coccineum]|uniref:Reverse transcriptase zinc-binding domain-containing protein n=1 Tax=Tanacetum coccineum TaxID=301880 RepID=A0ABQ4X584_9ASTR